MFRVFARSFATKPQKKVEVKVDKAQVAKQLAKKKAATEEFYSKNLKGSQPKDKNIIFFNQYMVNEAKRFDEIESFKRKVTLWEKLAADRYQHEISKQTNQLNFALECFMQIRDNAFEALPSEDLKEECRNAVKDSLKRGGIPLWRRTATWTPPDPNLIFKQKEEE